MKPHRPLDEAPGSLVRFTQVPTFQILYFRESVLDHAEKVEVRDVLAAIEKAAGKPPHLRIEIWSGHRRVAEIGPSPIHPRVSRRRKPK
ncbi:MAG: hypothetical protein ACJ8E3_08645 [Sphingomicrobium sp.]